MFTRIKSLPRGAKILGAVVSGTTVAGLTTVALASGDKLLPPSFPWDHYGPLSAYDHASLRRGHQVFMEVCSSCHSMNHLCWRNLVGVMYDVKEVKAMAAEFDYKDGPDDQGEYFMRPGKLTDPLPSPYANEEAARAANGGARPPDLSLITKGRMGYEDYIYALLTGYKDPPEGVQIRQGLYYNPYFTGGAISMPPPLMDEQVSFADGTIPTKSQLAKDVTTFLAWAAEPEMEERKLFGFKTMTLILLVAIGLGYNKRLRFAPIKSRKLWYR